jgi:hypothetical protein
LSKGVKIQKKKEKDFKVLARWLRPFKNKSHSREKEREHLRKQKMRGERMKE